MDTVFDVTRSVAKVCVMGLMALAVADLLVARHWKARYFFLHAFMNLAISCLVMEESLWLLTDPLQALGETRFNPVPLGLVFAIHFYHMLAPGFRLYPVDWLHHVVMVVFGCPLILFGAMGPLVNFNFLWICGIPGGIDYAMLTMVKEGKMLPLNEKRINTTLNVWCRCPLLISVAVMTYVQFFMHRPPLHIVLIRLFLMAINVWNALYFMERVVSNYYVTHFKLKQAVERKDAPDMSKMADVKDLKRKRILVDDPSEHPLPSAPMAPRTMKVAESKSLWQFIRSGS